MKEDKCFDEVWRRLADLARCDGFGGGEYERVRGEWERAGSLRKLMTRKTFILWRANLAPDDPGDMDFSPEIA